LEAGAAAMAGSRTLTGSASALEGHAIADLSLTHF
jgi:hypothetical protein